MTIALWGDRLLATHEPNPSRPAGMSMIGPPGRPPRPGVQARVDLVCPSQAISPPKWPAPLARRDRESMNRRHWFQFGAVAIGGLIGLVLAVPGVAYLLSPLLKRREDVSEFRALTKLGDLEVGQPRSFSIIEEQRDAWVSYPATPIGTVWLVRQPEGSPDPVIALSAECPHLACKIKQSGDGKGFVCPCHASNFELDGSRVNRISPRGMDALEVEPINPDDPEAEIRVKFARFRIGTEEKIPLA